MKRIAIFLLMIFLLAACSNTPADPAAPTPQANAPQVENPTAAPEATQPPTVVSPAEAVQEQRGPGPFDLTDPAAGLDTLPRYKASLQMVFDGTQGGQPYHVEKTYEQMIDREQSAWLLTEKNLLADGAAAETFTGLIGSVKYMQAAPDQPCQPSSAAAEQPALFDPAQALPPFWGGSEAGEESVGEIPTKVYTFEQLALGVGEEGVASGKVWIAQNGGWVVKYELSLISSTIFGEGISGEQRWTYQISEPGTAQIALPESCPVVANDLPLPDDAAGVIQLPGAVKFRTALSAADLGAFYTERLTAQGWTQQGDPVETEGGTRWLFSLPAGDQERVAVITAQAGDGGGLKVSVYTLQMAAASAQ